MSDSTIRKVIFSVLPDYIHNTFADKDFMIIDCNIQSVIQWNNIPNIFAFVSVTVRENYTDKNFRILIEFTFDTENLALLEFKIIHIEQIGETI